MADPKTHDMSDIAFSPMVFPSAEDMALWGGLSDAEKHAVIACDEEQGFQSGIAPKESLGVRLSRVRADRAV